MPYTASFTDWKKANHQSLELIFAEGKREFDHIVDLHNRISSRVFAMITAYIPLISVLIGYVFTAPESFRMAAALLLLCNLTVCLFILTHATAPRKKFRYPGMSPKLLLDGKIFTENDELSTAEQYQALLINQINAVQEGIDINEASNNQRLRQLRIVINLTTYSLIAAVFILIASFFAA